MLPFGLVKRCSKCSRLFPQTAQYFCKRKDGADGLRRECKNRHSEYNKAYRARPGSRERKNASSRRQYAANPENMKEAKRRWREKNKEKIKKRNKQYRRDNAERRREYNKQYWRDNTDKCKEVRRVYKLANREQMRADWHRRQAKIRGNGGAFSDSEWKGLCNAYGNVCLCCGSSGPLTVDHVVPLSEGGTNDISNIQPLCGSCNSKKHTDATDFRRGHRAVKE